MRDISDAADLMATAREALIAELLPSLPKERRYVGLMIANVMSIAAREHRLGPDTANHEASRLRNLLAGLETSASGLADDGAAADLTALRRKAAAAIRAGDLDAHETLVAAELTHTAADWVAISNPKALRAERPPRTPGE